MTTRSPAGRTNAAFVAKPPPLTGTLIAPLRVPGRELPRAPDVEHGPGAAAVQRPNRLRCADERPAIQLDDALHVRRPDAGADRLRHELVLVLVREGPVEAPLEADRRRSLVSSSRRRTASPRRGRGSTSTPSGSSSRRWRLWYRLARALGRLDGEVRAGSARRRRASRRSASATARRSRSRSMTANAQCSGRWPGVCTTRSETDPDRDLGAVLERIERRTPAPRPGGSTPATPCSSASRPWPDTWSACVCVSSTRRSWTPSRLAASRYCSIA